MQSQFHQIMNSSILSQAQLLEKLFATSQDLYEADRGEYYANSLYETITNRINLEQIKIISFDVFDTLLLRNSKYELYRYLEIAERVENLLKTKGIEHFSLWEIYAARLVAFRVCYRTVKQTCMIREGRLIDVLGLMAKILNLEKSILPELISLELAYETDNLRKNYFLNSFLDYSDIRSKEIIFISDMYMSGEHIYQLFHNYYPELKLRKYYSSADYGLTKLSGLLYDFVAEDLDIKCSQILHMGDNLKGDVQKAKERRWNAIHLPIPEIYLQERKKNKEKFKAELIAQEFDLSLIY